MHNQSYFEGSNFAMKLELGILILGRYDTFGPSNLLALQYRRFLILQWAVHNFVQETFFENLCLCLSLLLTVTKFQEVFSVPQYVYCEFLCIVFYRDDQSALLLRLVEP